VWEKALAMSALRSIVVVGLVALGACTHTAREPIAPTAPVEAPELAAPAQPPAKPIRVDNARLNLNSSFASLVTTDYGFVAPSRRPAYASAFAPTCRTSADCGGASLSCRAREDGVRVCMGVGSPGDACWFNTDCVSGTCSLDDGQRTCR
jgi:hypothetical protein